MLKFKDELCICFLQRFDYILVSGILVPKQKIFSNRTDYKCGLLRNIPNRLSQILELNSLNISSVKAYLPFLTVLENWLIEPLDHLNYCALAKSRRTHYGG